MSERIPDPSSAFSELLFFSGEEGGGGGSVLSSQPGSERSLQAR